MRVIFASVYTHQSMRLRKMKCYYQSICGSACSTYPMTITWKGLQIAKFTCVHNAFMCRNESKYCNTSICCYFNILFSNGLKWFLTCGEFPTGGEWRSCQVGNDRSDSRTTASKFNTSHSNVIFCQRPKSILSKTDAVVGNGELAR